MVAVVEIRDVWVSVDGVAVLVGVGVSAGDRFVVAVVVVTVVVVVFVVMRQLFVHVLVIVGGLQRHGHAGGCESDGDDLGAGDGVVEDDPRQCSPDERCRRKDDLATGGPEIPGPTLGSTAKPAPR